jgi:asparagine synthase (glutamine-hydrolysing)
VLPRVLAYLDEPFADASILPTYLLSGFTRERVTVALGGDGGDELFCGYETFRADPVADAWRRVPAVARRAVAAAAARMPVSTDNFSLDFVVKSFLRGADAPPERRHTRWLSAFLPHTPDDPLLPAVRDRVPDATVYGIMAAPYLECADHHPMQRLSYAYIRTYLAEDILTKVDRASMAHGLEVRSPFMDPELVSLVARMPARLKLGPGLRAKLGLKRAARGSVPDSILARKKKGFGIPVARWLNGALAGELDRLLAPERLGDVGLFDRRVVARLIDEHRAGTRDNRKQLWTLMMFEAWREAYGITV